MNEELETLRRVLAAIVAAEPSHSLAIPTTAIAWAEDLEMEVYTDERTRAFVIRVRAKNQAYPLTPNDSEMRRVQPFIQYQEDPGPLQRSLRSKP